MTINVTQHIKLWLFTLSVLVTLIQLDHPQIARDRGNSSLITFSVLHEGGALTVQKLIFNSKRNIGLW